MDSVDLTTFEFGPIAFSDKRIIPLPGVSPFTGEVDLRPAKPLVVRVHADVNADTAVVTWRLTAIDPSTGQIPDDPLGGFLPPNDESA